MEMLLSQDRKNGLYSKCNEKPREVFMHRRDRIEYAVKDYAK
jgi:hypothetical protein